MIHTAVVKEMDKKRRKTRNERKIVGDAVADGGKAIFVVNNKIRILPGMPGYSNWLEKKVPAIEKNKDDVMHCAVYDCDVAFDPKDKAQRQHHCYRQCRQKLIHSLCRMKNGLSDNDNELNMYCSRTCKSIEQYDG